MVSIIHIKRLCYSQQFVLVPALTLEVFDAVDLIIFAGSRGEFFFRNLFRSFRCFLRLFPRSNFFQILVRVDAIDLVRKSSKSELSSRFFGRLKIFRKIFTRVTDGRFPCGIKSTASRRRV